MTVYMAAQLFFIGNNEKGQCLLPDAGDSIDVPTAAQLDWLPDGTRILHTAVGDFFTLLLTDDNQLYAVGRNATGQLGRGHRDDEDPPVPRLVTGFGLERITQIAAGYNHCAALTEDGKLFLWGSNAEGQCGTGAFGGYVLNPLHCSSGALEDEDVRVVFVACGSAHTVALTSDGGVIAFGSNTNGQLGMGNDDYRQTTPERLDLLEDVRIMCCAAGDHFTQLVSNDGHVFAMGKNNVGQLGTGDTINVNTPTPIDFGGAPVAAVACGVNHTMAITRGEGTLYCWGIGRFGRTGLGHMDDATTPQPVVGDLAGTRVVRIAAGYTHSCALAEDGRVFAFGTAHGIPGPGGWNGMPQPIAVGATVCALGTGCYGTHAAFIAGAPPTEPGDGWLFEKIRQLKSQLAEEVLQYRTWYIAFHGRPEAVPILTTYPFAVVRQLAQKIIDMQEAYNMIVNDYAYLNEFEMQAGSLRNPDALACTQPLKF